MTTSLSFGTTGTLVNLRVIVPTSTLVVIHIGLSAGGGS